MPRSRIGRVLRVAGEHLLAVVLTLLLLAVALELWRVDWRVPFDYTGDGLFFSMLVRGLHESGWHLRHESLGAPFGLDMHDFPLGQSMHFLIMKGLGLFAGESPLVMNLYFVLTFPLTTVLTLAVFRHFRCAYLPALAGSLLYAFLPYHALRGEGHLLLSAYFTIPPIVMVAIWHFQGQPMFFRRDEAGRLRFVWNRKTVMALVIGCALAAGDIYYTFFASFLLVVASFARAYTTRTAVPLVNGGLLIAVMTACAVANVLPTVVYGIRHGKNPDAVRRTMQEAEFFGMRVSQLIMPVSGHRIPFVAHAKAKFNTRIMLVTENDMASLGLVGSLGFLVLLASLVAPSRAGAHPAFESLRAFNIAGVLLATIGGFGLLVAAVLPQIRAYNRMSVFLGFFSLFVVVLILQSWQERFGRTAARKVFFGLGLALLVVLGVLDQTPRVVGRDAADRAAQFDADAAFVAAIEGQSAPGAMIYQMPYRVFPEGGSYDHLRLSLHSHHLRWSYPTMRARPADFWHKDLASLAPETLLPRLIFAGFRGVCIDREGYPDWGKALEAKLLQESGAAPLVCQNQRFSYYALDGYAEKLRGQYSAEQWQVRLDEARYPVIVTWAKGFQQSAEMLPVDGRWCTADGVMELHNLGTEPRRVSLDLSLRTGHPEPATLKLDGMDLHGELTVHDKDGRVVETIVVPPGRHALHFRCDALPVNDNARRIFRVIDFKVRPLEGEQACVGDR
jgi:hypothetical protein